MSILTRHRPPLVLPGRLADWEFGGLPIAQRGKIVDLSGNGHHGTFFNKAAASFDGVNDKAAVAAPWDFLGGHSVCIVAGWFYIDSTGSSTRTLWYEDWNADTPAKVLVALTNTEALWVGARTGSKDDAFRSITSVATISQDTWHSLLVSINAATSRVSVWCDGEVFIDNEAMSDTLSQTTWAADVPNWQACGLGANDVWDFKGRIVGLRVAGADAVPTTADALKIHNWPLSFLENITWDARWRMNEGTGNPRDSSGNAHHLALTGAIWANAANLGQTWTLSDGSAGDSYQAGGMEFDADLEMADNKGNAAALDLTGAYSVFMAFKPDGCADQAGLWSRWDAGAGLELVRDSINSRLTATDGTNSISSVNASIGDAFHTACFVETGGNGQWYVDGVASGASGAFTAVSKAVDTLVGYGRNLDAYFNGRIYRVAPFDRALGAGEIEALDAVARGRWAS